ncbi:hypothetical protein NT6N_13770 [Oceaniferula spumae]|uniref:Uncharacterized protein n=1 Tax=Oceaniferula spumae TaxID=2979115 RepID=A0AAT9FK70_9BACT
MQGKRTYFQPLEKACPFGRTLPFLISYFAELKTASGKPPKVMENKAFQTI